MSSLTVNQPFFISGCQYKPASPAVCTPLSEEQFPDAATSLDDLLGSAAPGSILAFGYTHRQLPTQPSAVEHFAEEIMPGLAEAGYHDLVLEVFPRGNPDSQLELEIAAFNQTGNIGTEMNRYFNLVDRASFEHLLQQARDLGIQIHTGGVDLSNIFYTLWHPSFLASPQRILQARMEIARNSRDRIRLLVNEGKNVASLNGTLHNDLYPTQKSGPASFGKSLNAMFPGRFVEIDLVVPELSAKNKAYKDLPLSAQCNWESFIPSSGVNLVSEVGPNSYLLYWPKN